MNHLGKKGVSEIVGTVLLLAIAVTAFSVLAIYVYSNTSPSTAPPDLNLAGYLNEEQHIIIEHKGGDDATLEEVRLTIWKGEVDSATFYFNANGELVGDHGTFSGDDDGYWNLGEYIDINATAIFGNITHWQISAVVIDDASNSIIFSGVLQSGIVRTVSPVARFTYNPWNPKTQEIMVFNASQSYDPDGGQIITYQWDFGDGTGYAYGMIVIHRYTNSGTYNVTLTVTDDEGETGTATTGSGIGIPSPVNVTDNQPPVVNFTWSVDPDVDGTLNFFAVVSDPDGNIANASFEWNFGDGNSSSSQNPSHTYERSGDYTVTLIVTDEDGGVSSYETTVTVPNILPIAGFSVDRANITTASSVTFDGGSPYSYDKDGTIVNWTWDFENDSVIDAYGSTVTHLFSATGNYTVVLNVTDNEGGWTVYAKNITVYSPAEASPPRFLFVDNTPIGWESGIDNILSACESIMPASDYSWGKAIDQWTFTDDQYTSEDLRGENITDTVLNQFDIVIWSTGDFPGDGGGANQPPYNTMPNYWSTPMTEGGDDVSDHMREVEQHMNGNATAGTLLMCGTYAVRDLQDYQGNGVTQSEIDLGNVLGLIEPSGGIDYDSDWVPFSGRLGDDWFRGEPYTIQGTMIGVANTSSGQINIATLNITSPMYAYGLNKQSDSTFVYSLLANTSASEETLLHEDMETDPGWTTGGSQNEWEWGIPTYNYGPSSAHSGSRCYGTDLSYTYNDNAYCWVRTGYIDLSDASSATLEFYDWYEIEDGWDYVYLQVYDGSWHTIASFTGSQQSWTHKSYDISSYVGDSIRIRWLLDSDWLYHEPGYYLDDVWVNATQSSMPDAYFAIDAARGRNRSIILGFDLNADEITHESRTNYIRNVLAWLAEGAGYTTEVWVNNDPPEGWLDNESHVDTIQAGIDAVPPGGTVYVIGTDNQVYEENVVVDKSIDLIGIDNPTIRASGTNVVTVQVDWARIDGFTIEGNSVQNGIYIEDATRCIIINCTISTNISKMGIYLSSAHNNTIRNNTIQDGLYGIYADYSLGNTIRYNDISSNDGGIYLYQTSLTTVRDNTIHNNGNIGGIRMESGRQNLIYGNTIENNSGNGIHLISSTNKNEIKYNTIRNNSNGIWLEISNSNIIFNNTISNNSNDGVVCTEFSHSNTLRENNIYSNRYGVNLQNSSNNGIIYNTIEQNQRGMYFSSSSSNVLQSNTICNNTGDGIRMASSSDNNIIASCTIQNNSYGIYLQMSRNNTFDGNTISLNSADGIYLYYAMSGFSGENNMTDNTISSNTGSGISLYASVGNTIYENEVSLNGADGIRLFASSNENTITSNAVWNNSYGIHLDRSNFNNITNNTIHNHSADGIYIKNYASENDVHTNTIQYNANGIALSSSTINDVSGNTVALNREHGISLSSSTSNAIYENEIYSNTNSGIYLSSSDINQITNNTIWNNENGIYLVSSGGTGNTIVNNTVHSNSNHGIFLENSRTATAGNNELIQNDIYSNSGCGVYLYSSKINSIQNNEIYSNGDAGVYLNSSQSNTLQGNEIYGNTGHGLYLNFSNNNDIQSNNISFNGGNGLYILHSSQGDSLPIQDNLIWNNSEAGINISSSSNNYFTYNIIWNNSMGFSLYDSSTNNEIRYTILHNNSYGIHINISSTNNVIHDNNVTRNEYGVYIGGPNCRTNEVYDNNFLNNTLHNNSQAWDMGNNSWYVGTEGNYWSDRDPLETYYLIPPYGTQDKYPLASPRTWWL